MSWLSVKHSPLQEELGLFFSQLSSNLSQEELTEAEAYFANNSERLAQWQQCLRCSAFFRDEASRRFTLLLELFREDAFDEQRDIEYYNAHLSTLTTLPQTAFDQTLRQVRAQTMLRLIWRDVNRLGDMPSITQELSHFACASIYAALNYHNTTICEKHGEPKNKQGETQHLFVLGMGKLGANELNLSSDIDLIFCYPDKGSCEKGLSNQEFFSQLGKKIIASLDAQTADGRVFRVDMRLRPYGQSGALVSSFDALEEYYHDQGREWERYAMVKARVVATTGSHETSRELIDMLHQFTYRKYVDYSVIDALRKLKQMIRQEVARRRLENDVKLGSGGIREIEFTAQVFQLIRGGRDIELRNNRILEVLPLLVELRCMPQDEITQLVEAYHFLRNTEHAIQGYKDQQTQALPKDEAARYALVSAMGFEHWEAFTQALETHRSHVRAIFENVIAEPESAPKETQSTPWQALWLGKGQSQADIEALKKAGYASPEESLQEIQSIAQWAASSGMHATSHERLDTFMPLLLGELSNLEKPGETLKRITKLIKAIARRSAYLTLLIENPGALNQLLTLTQASPWIADEIAEHPALLDELLDPSTLYDPPDKNELQAELKRTMLRIAEDDLEAQMEALRYFRSSHALRVAASEISGVLPLMKVSDYLTWIAEVILEFALDNAWKEMARKHGYPDGEQREHPNMIIVAYGKMGGIELGHGSDLDLVFIHGANINGESDGKRALDNHTYYTRLGQKIIHFLTTNMSSGELYEVDMRLRPSGNSGLLVATMDSFTKYQRESAWTWEHQALVRARAVAGDAALAKSFDLVRHEILMRERDIETLRDEVVAMREKMRAHLGSKPNETETFHLKHDAGGIVDIEFMVQYAVLAWAHAHPALAEFTDNIRILESIPDSEEMTTQEVGQLTEAYKAFRAAGHRLTLQHLPATIAQDELLEHREAVSTIWQRVMGNRDIRDAGIPDNLPS